MTIDRLGLCPHCNKSWNGGDVYEVLNSMSLHLHKSQRDIENLANQYGWTKTNPSRFSKARTIEVTIQTMEKFFFYECFNCNHVFEATTGKQYNSYYEAKQALFPQVEDEG